ncbi:hypothetical protein DEH18_33275 [Streptomyces sp. NHF165]|uniref:recombinase family protein n=1 Tax=Streptomyces sp. NHF165 TaxID=2175864 RepID=UPI00132EC908|nr:recombinase family protein [Streptomyces sp. NHF165]QHF97904.1 hypothetical protein DEH18_33275 [Streptomyces sp. NHF165]
MDVPAAFRMHIPETFRPEDWLDDREPFIGYVRVSTWREEQISPELQKTAIDAWAQRTRRRIIGWIVDLDMSGRTFQRKIMRGIEGIEGGFAQGIAVWKYSRYGRDRNGNQMNLARIEGVGGRLESATEEVDARTAIGRFQRGMLLELAAFESDRAGEQWKETHAHRRAIGLPATGRPRWGYIWHPRRIPDGRGGIRLQQEWYEVEQQLEPVVEQQFLRYVASRGFDALTADLNAGGYTTATGGPWERSMLATYMDSGWAAGLLYVHDPSCTCTTHGRGCNRYIHIPGAQEPIISMDLWEHYKRRREVTRTTSPRGLRGTYELTSLQACRLCRGACRFTSYSSRQRGISRPGYAVRCRRRTHAGASECPGVWVRRTVVEEAVREWLRDEVAPAVDAAPGHTASPTPEESPEARRKAARTRLEADRDRADAAISRLMTDRARAPELYPEEAYARAVSDLRRDRDKALEGLAAIEREEAQPTVEKFRPVVVSLLDEWETITTREKNAILRTVIRRVAIFPDAGGAHRFEIHPVWEPDPWARPVLAA